MGVPAAVRRAVAAELRQRGLEVTFDRLRLRWYQGLVAERVSGQTPGDPRRLRWAADELELKVHWRALWRRRALEIHTLTLRNGHLVIPLAEPDVPSEELEADQISARLDLANPALWRVEELSGRLLGLTVRVQGAVTNGFALMPRAPRARDKAAPPPPDLVTWLRAIRQAAENVTVEPGADVWLRFAGDAQSPESWHAELQTRPAQVETPWGRWRSPHLHARWQSAAAPDHPPLEVRLGAAELTAPQGIARALEARAEVFPGGGGSDALRVRWELAAEGLHLLGGQVNALRGRGLTEQAPDAPGHWRSQLDLVSGPFALAGVAGERGSAQVRIEHAPGLTSVDALAGRVAAEAVHTREARAGRMELEFAAQRVASPANGSETAPKWVKRGKTVELRLATRTSDLNSPWLAVDRLQADAHWRFPELTLTHLRADLLGGSLRISRAGLDLGSRTARAELALDFDVQRLNRVLSPRILKWLGDIAYATPPRLSATAEARLPDAGVPLRDWGAHLLSGLVLRGRVDGRDAGYRGLRGDSVGLTVLVSNQVLNLRDLVLERPEGRAVLAYDLNLRTRDFRWRVDCGVDPHAAASAVEDDLVPILAPFRFTTPPRITGEVWGNWNPPKPVDFALHVAATNFTFRGEPFDQLEADLGKTNQWLTATNLRLTRGEEWLEAPVVCYDLTNRMVTLHEVRSRMDPLRIARCLGPRAEETLRPYRFEQPPAITTHGSVSATGDLGTAALDFEVAGGPFAFWRLQAPQVTAGVRWRGDRVSVTNVAAAFYGGRLSGGIDLALQREGDARFAFQAQATEFNLQPLLQDVLPHSTNRVEGVTTVSLIVTDALTSDWKSWNGRGRAELRDGLLWDLPIFGLLSRGLNLMVPGLGNSRARAARATFTLEHSVLRTEDLAIDAGLARLQYRGTVDFDGRVEARVVAEVLHRTPIIGPLISLALTPVAKVLEYRVSGTLAEPELQPLHVPGFLRPLLNPLGTLQNLVAPPGESSSPGPKP